jgi:hypothetical protein
MWFRDRFLTLHTAFSSLEELNRLTHEWVENDYNNAFHSAIQMKPIDRFNLDRARIKLLADDAFCAEVFFVPQGFPPVIEETRKVSKDECFFDPLATLRMPRRFTRKNDSRALRPYAA